MAEYKLPSGGWVGWHQGAQGSVSWLFLGLNTPTLADPGPYLTPDSGTCRKDQTGKGANMAATCLLLTCPGAHLQTRPRWTGWHQRGIPSLPTQLLPSCCSSYLEAEGTGSWRPAECYKSGSIAHCLHVPLPPCPTSSGPSTGHSQSPPPACPSPPNPVPA